MTGDYYSPHPQITLPRPLVLIGHPAAGVDQVGRTICGRTGLAFNDVERAAESVAGASRSRLVVDRGIDELRAVERAALEKALRREPVGVVVMESGLLEAGVSVEWLQARGLVVYVRRPDAVLLGLVREKVASAPGSLPEFLLGAPNEVDELRGYLAERERALRRVDVVVDAGRRSASALASEILASLDRLLDIERVGQ